MHESKGNPPLFEKNCLRFVQSTQGLDKRNAEDSGQSHCWRKTLNRHSSGFSYRVKQYLDKVKIFFLIYYKYIYMLPLLLLFFMGRRKGRHRSHFRSIMNVLFLLSMRTGILGISEHMDLDLHNRKLDKGKYYFFFPDESLLKCFTWLKIHWE